MYYSALGQTDPTLLDIQYGGGDGTGVDTSTSPFTGPAYTPPDVSGGPSVYDIQYGAPGEAPTAGTYEEQAGVQAGNIAPVVAPTNWLASIFGAGTKVAAATLAPGPAPRVSVPVAPTSVLTSSSIIKGVPDIAVLGIGAVLAFSLIGGLSGGRRRR